MIMKKWYVGVTHSHTNRSDGIFTPDELVKHAEKKGLEFLMITDHNQNLDKLPESDKLTVIFGTELTKHGGHTNLWGVQYAVDDFECEEYEDYLKKLETAKSRGATTCMNHPLCSQCTWRWPREPERLDCVEVWNSPQHLDNMKCTEWWADELRKGKKIPVVGGSDFHRDYYVTNLLPNPVTYVYADSNSVDDILRAIREGKTTISYGVGKTFIEITCGDKMLGDTVSLEPGTKAEVKVKGLKKNHTLKVIGPKGVVYEYTAKKKEDHTAVIPVTEPGFLYAVAEYKVSPPYKFIHNKVLMKKVNSVEKGDLPPFIYAQTGAIYFE